MLHISSWKKKRNKITVFLQYNTSQTGCKCQIKSTLYYFNRNTSLWKINSMPSQLFLTENFKQMLPTCGIFLTKYVIWSTNFFLPRSQKENISAKTKHMQVLQRKNMHISDPQNYVVHPQWTRAEIPKPSHATKFTFQCMYQFIFVTAKATAYNKIPLTPFGRQILSD